MNQNNLQLLAQILGALGTIETKGDSTITMSQCLQALQQVIQSEQEALQQTSEKEGE